MSFVSAGLRKTAAEEKPELKEQGGSDDSEDDSPVVPPPPHGTASKKLQMVDIFARLLIPFHVYLLLVLFKQNAFFRGIIVGTSPKGLQVSLDNHLAAGKSTQKGLDKNFCRKWATSQAKALVKMLKVNTHWNT